MLRGMFHSKFVIHFHALKMKKSSSSRQTTQQQKAAKNKMIRTEKSLDEIYEPYLFKLMSFKDGVTYASIREFTNEELA